MDTAEEDEMRRALMHRAFFWVVIRRRLWLPATLTPRSFSSSTSWLSGLLSCTPALQWQPLLPITTEEVTVMLNHGSILLPLTRVSPTRRSFLSQCSLTFSLQLSCFPTEHSKVPFTITLLVGQARERVGDGHMR